MAWKITNALKKQAVEVETFGKDTRRIVREHGWRWASVTVLDKPDLSIVDEDDYVDALTNFGDVIDQDSSDGCWEDWTYPDDMSDKEREEIKAAWEEDWSLEGLGWESDDCELRLYGPLEVEEVETPEWYKKMLDDREKNLIKIADNVWLDLDVCHNPSSGIVLKKDS